MGDRSGELRLLEGGGEPDPEPGPDDPYPDWEAHNVCADPASTPSRLFATYRELHRRYGHREYGMQDFSRAYARRLAADAHAADFGEVVALLDDVGLRDRTYCDHIIWDDMRPRQLHIWPEGGEWGWTPPRPPQPGEPIHSYTVCGRPVRHRMWHSRAERGEWRSYYAAFEMARRADSGEKERLLGYGVADARRICAECAEAVAYFPECAEGERALAPDWWFAAVRAEAAATFAECLGSGEAVSSPKRLQALVEKAYRSALQDWVARQLRQAERAPLRKLYGERRSSSSRRDVLTEYDELARLTQRLTKREPHELLHEKDWARLVRPYLPGQPARAAAEWDDRPHARFRAELWARVEDLARAAAKKA